VHPHFFGLGRYLHQGSCSFVQGLLAATCDRLGLDISKFHSKNLPVAESKRPSGAHDTQNLIVHEEVVLAGVLFKVSRGQ
jgi:hypothetical protein